MYESMHEYVHVCIYVCAHKCIYVCNLFMHILLKEYSPESHYLYNLNIINQTEFESELSVT